MAKIPKSIFKRIRLPINYDKSHWTKRREAREEYVRRQKGKCYYCKGALNKQPPQRVRNMPVTLMLYPPDFYRHPIHLHHSHVTGMTIGAVHAHCNAVLWEYENE